MRGTTTKNDFGNFSAAVLRTTPTAFHGPSLMKEAKSKALYRSLLELMRGCPSAFDPKLISYGKGNCRLNKANLDAVAPVGPIYGRNLEFIRRHTTQNHGILCGIMSGKGLFGSDKNKWEHWLVWLINCRSYGTGAQVAEKGANGYGNGKAVMCGSLDAHGEPIWKHDDLSVEDFANLETYNFCLTNHLNDKRKASSAFFIGGIRMEKACNNPTCEMKVCKERYAKHFGLDVQQQVELVIEEGDSFSKSDKKSILQKMADGVQPRVVEIKPAPRVPEKKSMPSGGRTKMEANVGKNKHTRTKDEDAARDSQMKKKIPVQNSSDDDQQSEASEADEPLQKGKSTGFKKKKSGRSFIMPNIVVGDPKKGDVGEEDEEIPSADVADLLLAEEASARRRLIRRRNEDLAAEKERIEKKARLEQQAQAQKSLAEQSAKKEELENIMAQVRKEILAQFSTLKNDAADIAKTGGVNAENAELQRRLAIQERINRQEQQDDFEARLEQVQDEYAERLELQKLKDELADMRKNMRYAQRIIEENALEKLNAERARAPTFGIPRVRVIESGAAGGGAAGGGVAAGGGGAAGGGAALRIAAFRATDLRAAARDQEVDQDDDDDVSLDTLKAARARDKAADARAVAARRRIKTASEFSPHDNDQYAQRIIVESGAAGGGAAGGGSALRAAARAAAPRDPPPDEQEEEEEEEVAETQQNEKR